MCGICGVKGLSSEDRGQYVNAMLGVLRHRGPDEEGKYSDEEICLGIRRLSIIDLETGSQPIYNEDKMLVAICNGEIYNFHTLRSQLIERGHRFYTKSDTEVLVHLYEEYGIDCLGHIKGMFSFGLWDKNKKRLFIARDRFGIKPLYYYCKNGIFSFSSELKALLKLPFINRELNDRALHLYFSLEYVPSPYSIFKDIYKLRPSHYMVYENNSFEIRRYWDLKNTAIKSNLFFLNAKEKFKDIFNESIREHLISDVPLGFFLSGGIDSSTLVALARKIYNQNFSTFSIDFESKSFDGSEYSLLMSKRLGTKHYSYIFTIDDFINNFNCVTSLLDEPFADLSIFPTYILSKFSHEHIKVALSGEGADELFMGYPTYPAHRYAQLSNMLPHSLKKVANSLIDLLPVSFEYLSLDFKLKKLAEGLKTQNNILRHMLWMGSFFGL